MKLEDFKNMVREIIREELESTLSEQAYQWWLAPAEAETPDAHLNPSQVHEEIEDSVNEEEYDDKRDQHPSWGMTGRAWTPRPSRPVRNPAKTFRELYIRTMLQSKITYTDENGKKGEATMASLLRYPKDHPGRKAAARAYAMGLQRAPKDEGICEGEGCIQEKSVPQPYDRKSARKMTKSQVEKRKQIGQNMMSNEKTVSKFRKKYGDEWKDYIWAAASSAAFRQAGSSKGDDKKK